MVTVTLDHPLMDEVMAWEWNPDLQHEGNMDFQKDPVRHTAARSLRSRYIANPFQTIAYTPPAPCISSFKGLSPARGSPDPCPGPPPVHSTRPDILPTSQPPDQFIRRRPHQPVGYRKQRRRRGGWWVYRSIMQAIIDSTRYTTNWRTPTSDALR